MNIKEIIERSINDWNNYPDIKSHLSLDEQCFGVSKELNDSENADMSCILTLFLQEVIYKEMMGEKAKATVNFKDRLMVIKWTSNNIDNSKEKCYLQLLENLIGHGFMNSIRTLEDTRKFNPTHKLQTV